MSGRRAKQLHRECKRRLGRDPLKANGHVTMRSMITFGKDKQGRTLLQRVWAVFKRKKNAPVQIDEFRYFKRNGFTPQEFANARIDYQHRLYEHEQEVERNNDRLAELRRLRVEAVAC